MKKPMFVLASALALLLFVAACSTADPAAEDEEPAPEEQAPDFSQLAGDVVTLEVGQQIALPSYGGATLTFVEKSEDSRCPSNVTCVWEGQAKIVLAFARAGQEAEQFEMVGYVGPQGYGSSGSPRITHDASGLRFTLQLLTPYPLDGVDQTDPVTATVQVEAL